MLQAELCKRLRSDLALAAAALFCLLNAAFFPYLWGGKTLLSSAATSPSIYATGALPATAVTGFDPYNLIDPPAAAWQTEPDFAQIHRELFLEKHLPLWNPGVGYGQPLAADMISQPYFPLSLLVVLHPSSVTYNWWCVARLFIAGLGAFCFLRLFVGFWPSLAAAISLAFGGYYLLFLNIAHLSVETLIPWLFYVNERLMRTPRYSTIISAAGVNVLVYLAGMPESQLLALTFAYLYAIYRTLTDPRLRRNTLRIACALVVVGLSGAAGAAFLLLPFVEYARLALDQHQAINVGSLVGTRHDDSALQGLTYGVPLLFGPPWSSVLHNLSGWAGVRGFFGVTALYLSLVALIATLADRSYRYQWNNLVPFFSVAICFFVLKRFGSPLVNWFGALPGFSLVGFEKYDEPLLAFAVASMAGLGLARIADSRPSGIIGWSAGAIVLAYLTATYQTVQNLETSTMPGRAFTVNSMLFAVTLLALVALIGLARRIVAPKWVGGSSIVAIVTVLTFEVLTDYLIPMHYVVESPPSSTSDPYQGAPYIAFLKTATAAGRERVFGLDSLLYPDWSGAFGLYDVRDLDAMYDRRYLPFVRAFLTTNKSDPQEFSDRFVGTLALHSAQQLRFLALSSIRYIVASHSLEPADMFFAQAYEQNIGNLPVERKSSLLSKHYMIAEIGREGLLEHPPFDRLPLHVAIPAASRRFEFSIGMDPAVYAPEVAICGAGAAFTLEIRDGTGKISLLFKRYIDPKHNIAQRKWIDESVDISPWAGKAVDLLLSTQPDVVGDLCADWAIWGGGSFVPNNTLAKSPYTLVFRDGDARVYEFRHPLPRVSVYENAETAPSNEQALRMLTDPGFDVTQTAIVTAGTSQDSRDLAGIDAPRNEVAPGKIIAYDSEYVSAHVSARRRSLVVLNDTAFPGWHAFVDGVQAPVLQANSMFRGVVVEPGEHSIEFKYQPKSFSIGLAISLTTLLGAIIAGFARRQKGTRPPADSKV